MLRQLIKTLIIKRRHHLGIYRLAVTVFHAECPLFLLTWCQTITEGRPLHTEFLIWQRTENLCRMGIALAILHPSKGQQQTVAIVLLVVEFQVQQLIVTVYGSTLNHLIASEDAIDDMHVSIR